LNTLFIFLYRIAIQLYGWSIKVVAIINPKAKLWVKGRRGLFDKLAIDFKEVNKDVLWFHCASLGEFEQGRPIIETLKKNYPQYYILLTFFSPSGFEVRKEYLFADYICYLPLDTPTNAKKFIEIVRPKLAFFIKYEFWYFYLSALKQKQIPYYLVAGVFRKDQLFFKPYGQWYFKAIEGFEQLFLQDPSSITIAKKFGFEKAQLTGDTRVDRVMEIAKSPSPIPTIEKFKADRKLMILGSTHEKDEAIFFNFLKKIKHKKYYEEWKFLVVPHEIDVAHIQKIAQASPESSVRFSFLQEEQSSPSSLLILDTIGQLNAAYQYGDLVYIGGGFDDSIHNILEPAVFGLPIIFGPKYHKFMEAKILIDSGGAFEVSDVANLIQVFDKLQNLEERRVSGEKCSQYINRNSGAVNLILNYLKNKNVI